MELWQFVLLIVVAIILLFITVYNMLVSARQKVHEAWSDVDVQLKRRRDLIPNVVETVKGYAKHEKDLIERVTKERAEAMKVDPDNLKKLGVIEGTIEEDLSALLMVAEAYPDLKANTNFLKLQDELSETEDQIASSRRIYNSNVTSYNTMLQVFPLNLVGIASGFKEASFLEFKDAKAVPSAKIN